MTTRTSRITRLAAVLGIGAALVFAATPSASAGSIPKPGKGASLDDWKKVEDARIAVRLKTLDALSIAVHGATDLTADHRAALSKLIATDRSGLGVVKVKIDGDTDLASVKKDGRDIVVDFRIYMLATPQVRFTIATDIQTAAVTKLKGVHDKLAAVVIKLGAAGTDVSKEQAQLDDMTAKLAAVTSAINGKADALLAVTPSPDASAMHDAVTPVRAAMHSGRDNLKAAIADAKQIRTELKALVNKS